jgi:hypothetical protein
MPGCGHGHVWPEPDGFRVNCGGPSVCQQCIFDLVGKLQSEVRPASGRGWTATEAIRWNATPPKPRMQQAWVRGDVIEWRDVPTEDARGESDDA